ncbi:unnamed protein product, partial [Trichobilharzia regenti]
LINRKEGKFSYLSDGDAASDNNDPFFSNTTDQLSEAGASVHTAGVKTPIPSSVSMALEFSGSIPDLSKHIPDITHSVTPESITEQQHMNTTRAPSSSMHFNVSSERETKTENLIYREQDTSTGAGGGVISESRVSELCREMMLDEETSQPYDLNLRSGSRNHVPQIHFESQNFTTNNRTGSYLIDPNMKSNVSIDHLGSFRSENMQTVRSDVVQNCFNTQLLSAPSDNYANNRSVNNAHLSPGSFSEPSTYDEYFYSKTTSSPNIESRSRSPNISLLKQNALSPSPVPVPPAPPTTTATYCDSRRLTHLLSGNLPSGKHLDITPWESSSNQTTTAITEPNNNRSNHHPHSQLLYNSNNNNNNNSFNLSSVSSSSPSRQLLSSLHDRGISSSSSCPDSKLKTGDLYIASTTTNTATPANDPQASSLSLQKRISHFPGIHDSTGPLSSCKLQQQHPHHHQQQQHSSSLLDDEMCISNLSPFHFMSNTLNDVINNSNNNNNNSTISSSTQNLNNTSANNDMNRSSKFILSNNNTNNSSNTNAIVTTGVGGIGTSGALNQRQFKPDHFIESVPSPELLLFLSSNNNNNSNNNINSSKTHPATAPMTTRDSDLSHCSSSTSNSNISYDLHSYSSSSFSSSSGKMCVRTNKSKMHFSGKLRSVVLPFLLKLFFYKKNYTMYSGLFYAVAVLVFFAPEMY